MDIIGALTVASQSVKLAKDLKDLERELDAATYKAKMAELYSNLADIKMALTDATELLHEKDAEIKRLKAELTARKTGEVCQLCGIGAMKVMAIKDDPVFGVFGHKQHTLICQNADCGHQETRKVVPPER